MPDDTLFEHESGGFSVTVEYDRDDENLPIYIEADGLWLSEDTANKLIGSVAAALGTKVEVGPRPNISGTDLNADLLRVAIAHGESVIFRYAKGANGSVIETRSLVPNAIQAIGDHETVVGYDPDREDVRAYRLDRIKGNVQVVA
jgi:predicted DNA-binding transcriptional regulator YafY